MGLSVHIDAMRDNAVAQRFCVESGGEKPIKIGRLSSAQICLDDPAVARIHAVIEFSAAGASIRDLGSTCGTKLGDTRLKIHNIAHGDHILVGKTTLVFGLGEPFVPMLPVSAAPALAPNPAPAFQAPIPAETQRPTRTTHYPKHPALPPEPILTAGNRCLEVRTYWGQVPLRINHYIKPQSITIGEIKGTDFFVSSEGLPSPAFPLIRCQGNDYELSFSDAMAGEVEVNGEHHSLASLRGTSLCSADPDLPSSYSVPLATHDRALVHWGGATFALRFVPPALAPKNSFIEHLEPNYLNTLLASAIVHAVALVALLVYPYNSIPPHPDLFGGTPKRFAELILSPPKPPEPGPERTKKEKPHRAKTSDKGQRSQKLWVPSGRRNLAADRFQAFFASPQGGLFAPAGANIATELSQAIRATGIPAGIPRGTGPTGAMAMGTSRSIGVISGSTSLGPMAGGAVPEGSLGKRKTGSMIALEVPIQKGALPPEVIQTVISRHRGQVLYCYEKALQKNQSLQGRLLVRWTIGPRGKVTKVWVQDNDLGDPSVAACVKDKVRRWVFPAPAGGGVVEVGYPFVFRAG